MFWLLRRLFWFGTGASLGFGGAMWIRSRVRRAVARYAPEQLTAELGPAVAENVHRAGDRVVDDVRQASVTVRDAWEEGRSAMRRRETELHEQLNPQATIRRSSNRSS